MPRCWVYLDDLKEFPNIRVWSDSIDKAQGSSAQPRGVAIFAGVFSCKFLVLFWKTRKQTLTVKWDLSHGILLSTVLLPSLSVQIFSLVLSSDPGTRTLSYL